MKRLPILGVAILFIALAARIWRLEFQSLWWDEGVSIYLSGAGLRALTVGKDFSVDLHAPGYHLALALWREVFGPSVFADRLLSVFAGVMTVPLTYAFTRLATCSSGDTSERERLPGPGGAPIVASLFAAISPIDVFYSQETRMYAFLPLLGLLSLIATFRVLRTGRRDAWFVWILINLVAWYVYYYLALLTVAESACLLFVSAGILGRKRSNPNLKAWLAANLALVLGYLPWLAIVARRAVGTSLALPPETATHPSPVEFVVDIVRSLTVGFSSPPGGAFLLLFWVILAVAGAILLGRRNPIAVALLLLSVVIPIAGAGAILVERPFFYPRFILFVVGPIWTLAAIGLCSVHRSWVVSGLLLLPLVAGGGWTWFEERTTARTAYSSADYRVVFDSLASTIQSGDAILGGYPWEAGYAEAYFWRKAPHVAYAPRGAEASAVSRLLGETNRLWLFTYDPGRRFVGDPLEAAAGAGRQTMAVDQYGDTRLRLFSAAPSMSVASELPLATFDGDIELTAASATPQTTARSGDNISVMLRWRAIRKPATNDTVFVHLIGPDGKLWGQHDAPPLSGAFPTGEWSAGEVVVDRLLVPIVVGAPPGTFQIVVGLYHPESGHRLTVGPRPMPDDQVIIGSFQVRGE